MQKQANGAIDLLQIPTANLVELWGELVEAYLGKNGYGGDVAELYAYRFASRSPAAAAGVKKAVYGQAIQARRSLHALLYWFAERYPSDILIDDKPLSADHGLVCPFEHRVHVTIRHRRRKSRA